MEPIDSERLDATPAFEENDIREAVARLLASDDFRASPQLAAFLRFIVDQTLDGRPEVIKGYTIATEALGRDAAFDPQTDPIVRVEATRLRRALDRYYATSGAGDPVEIVVPKGGYVPLFVRRDGPREAPIAVGDAEPETPFDEPTRRRQPLMRRVGTTVVALALAFGLVAVVLLDHESRSGAAVETVPASATASLGAAPLAAPAARSDLPSLRIEPFVELGDLLDGPLSARGLMLRLRDALARFDEIVVLTNPAPQPGLTRAALEARHPPDASRSPGSYVLGGWLEGQKDGRFNLGVTLETVPEGRVVWTRQFEGVTPDPIPGVTETSLVRTIATTLALPSGVIVSDLRGQRHTADGEMSRFDCLLTAVDYWHDYSIKTHRRARDCLERESAREPSSALVESNLAFMLAEEYRTGFNRREGRAVLDQALVAAQEALRVRPQSARAQQALMSVLFSRGDFDGAMRAGATALLDNPYDSDVIANLGARRIALGDVESGAKMIEEASQYSPVRTPLYEFGLFLASALRRDATAMAAHAQALAPSDYPLALIARAISAAELGDHVSAKATVQRLLEVQPDFGRNTRAALARWGASDPVLDRLTEGLAKAGLDAHGSSID